MEWRIAQLNSEISRLCSAVEGIKNELRLQREREHEKSMNRAYLFGYFVINAILLGGLAAGFGWI